jgi:O-antigen biosynthesis protein
MILTLPLLIFVIAASSVQAFAGAAEASNSATIRPRVTRLKVLGITAFLHLLQPLARLRGRFACYRAPWRKLSVADLSLPRPRSFVLWSERWRAPEEWLRSVEAALRASGASPIRGGDYDRWDLELRGGRLGAVRLGMAIEEHGGGKQLARFRGWPRFSIEGLVAILLLVILSAGAAFDHAWVASTVIGALAAVLVLRALLEGAFATTAVVRTLEELPGDAVALAGTTDRSERRGTT